MKKILYLVTEDWYFWSHRRLLAEEAIKTGYEVTLVTKSGEYYERIKSIGVNIIPIDIVRTIASPIQELKTLTKLISIYKEVSPDLVHHVSLKPVLMGSIAAWFSKVPKVVNAYTGLGYIFISTSWSSRIFLTFIVPVLSLLFKRKNFFSIVQNNDDAGLLENKGLIKPGKYMLIPGSGVEMDEFAYTPEQTGDLPVVLFASRLLVDKGLYDFIEACRLLKNDGVLAKCVLAGDIDSENPTSIKSEELNAWIENNIVEWWGYREDMYDVIRKSNIVCLPSYREGLPKILLEAASVGRAIVTTDVPGCRDCVVNGKNGLIVPVEDPVKLAKAIQQLIDEPETRKQMGKAGHEIINDSFDMNTVNNQTIALYNTLLSD